MFPLTPDVTLRYTVTVRGYGSLAQLVEHRTFNPRVTGSNPVRPTTSFGEIDPIV
jgi:hypothetical protein